MWDYSDSDIDGLCLIEPTGLLRTVASARANRYRGTVTFIVDTGIGNTQARDVYKNEFMMGDDQSIYSARISTEGLNVSLGLHPTYLEFEFHCTYECNAVGQYRRHRSNMEKFLRKTHGIAEHSNAQTRPSALRSTVTDPTLKLDKKSLDALQDMFIAAALSRLPPLKSTAEPGMGGSDHDAKASQEEGTEFGNPRPPETDTQLENYIEKHVITGMDTTRKKFTIEPEPEDLLHPSTDWIDTTESKYDALLTDVELPDIDKDDCMPGLTIHHSVGQQTTIDNGDDPT